MALSERQRRFVAEYLVSGSAKDAYQQAGYKSSGHVAESAGSRLLRNVEIQEAIKRAQSRLEIKAEVSREWVLKGFRRNLERAMQQEAVLDKEGNPTGEYRYDGAVANKALEMIGKAIGMFNGETPPLPTGDVNLNVTINNVSVRNLRPDQLQAIRDIQATLEGADRGRELLPGPAVLPDDALPGVQRNGEEVDPV